LKIYCHIIFYFFLIGNISCTTSKKTIKNKDSKNIVSKQESRIKKLLIEGTTEKIIGNLNEADSLFKMCLTIAPKNAVCFYELSGISLQKNEIEDALAFAEKAADYQPKNEWYKLNLALIFIENKKEKEAIKIFEELTFEHPERYEYLYSLSDSYINVGEYKKAISPLDKLEKLIGKNPELLVQKHRLYLQIGEQENAINEIQKLIDNNPKEVKFHGLMAELYESLGEDEKALKQYQKILAIDSINGIVNISLYQYYIIKGEKEKAFTYLRPAIRSKDVKLEPKIDVLLRLFNEFQVKKESREFIFNLCELLISTHPDQSKSYSIYADYLLQDKQEEKALEYFKKSVVLDQQTYALWSQIIILESNLNKLEQLKEDSKKAMEIFPTQPTFYYFNGYANNRLGNYQDAVTSLNIGKELVIEDHYLLAEFYQLLGDAYHELEDHDLSDLNYDLSLEEHPNNPFVLNNYSYYLALRKKSLPKAEKMIKRAIELNTENANYLDTYGWILFLEKKYTDSEFWLLKAIDFGGAKNGTILEHYGDVLFKLNKKEKALKYWKMAQENNNTSPTLIQKINLNLYIE